MSDTSDAPTTATTPRRRRGPASRKTIVVGGKTYGPRDFVAEGAGVNPKTAQRKCRNVVYVGGVAYVDVEQGLRDLLGLNPQPTRRGPYRKSGK